MNLWTLLSLFLVPVVSSEQTGGCLKPILEGKLELTDESLMENDYPSGTVLTLECAYGYLMDQGSNTITCTDGNWSTPELACKKKDCGEPSPASHMHYEINNGTLLGALIKPVCDKGYYLQGSSYRQCIATGWSGRSECLVLTCEKPPRIPHSIIVTNLTKTFPEYKDIIKYSCEENYMLVGNSSISCQHNGSYSSPLPNCIELQQDSSSPTYINPSTTMFPTSFSIIFTTRTTPSGLQEREPSSSFSSHTVIVIIIVAVIGFVSIVIVVVLVLRQSNKRKGSYDTGEGLKTKEELLQKPVV